MSTILRDRLATLEDMAVTPETVEGVKARAAILAARAAVDQAESHEILALLALLQTDLVDGPTRQTCAARLITLTKGTTHAP